MSAWILPAEQLAAIVGTLGPQTVGANPRKLRELGRLLEQANRDSVDYRYDERNPIQFIPWARIDHYARNPLTQRAVAVALASWSYQACEGTEGDTDARTGTPAQTRAFTWYAQAVAICGRMGEDDETFSALTWWQFERDPREIDPRTVGVAAPDGGAVNRVSP